MADNEVKGDPIPSDQTPGSPGLDGRQGATEPLVSVGDVYKPQETPAPEKAYVSSQEGPPKETIKKGLMIAFDPTDLSTYGQANRIFTVPGMKALHKVYMGTLWEMEEEEIAISISHRINPLDMLTRNLVRRKEVLVKAIYKIDDKEFTDPKNPENERMLKMELRDLLGKFSEPMVDLWYFCYQKLCEYRDSIVDSEVSQLKKSLGLADQEL